MAKFTGKVKLKVFLLPSSFRLVSRGILRKKFDIATSLRDGVLVSFAKRAGKGVATSFVETYDLSS